MNFDLNLTPYTKMNSKWTIDLKVKNKTITLLEDNREKSSGSRRVGEEIFEMALKP